MSLLELESHKEVVRLSIEIEKFLQEPHLSAFKNIVNSSKEYLRAYSLETMIVPDITETEKGIFRSTVKSVIESRCLKKDGGWSIFCKFKPSNGLLSRYTLFRRERNLNGRGWHNQNKLETQINEILKNEIEQEFINFKNEKS